LLLELDEVRRNSMMDSLLNIWNRGAIEDILKREADLGQRQKTQISVLMIDIDFFKNINDVYGHPIGDAALLSVVKALRHQLRSYDSVGRYGGEEFLAILPNTSQKDAAKLAERLRIAVSKANIKSGDDIIHCTVSLGLASADFSDGAVDINQVVVKADNALLQAKLTGRNRVEVAA
ncbi:MAG TPA: GGDEF domain-containing protein, partial [Methyloradius sp.]